MRTGGLRGFASLAVLVAVIATPVHAGTGAESAAAPTSRVCDERGWAATVDGRPSVLARTPGSGYFVWHDGAGWHLGLKAKATQTLEGRVTSTAPLRLVRVPQDVRAALKQQTRSITFRLAGRGALRVVDFKTPCAGRVVFQLGNGTSASAPAPGPPTVQSPAQPPIFLGAKGQAPGRSFTLHRPASTGVVGRILIGPTCPVIGAPDCPPAKPGRGTIRIETAPTSRAGGGGKLVATVDSDASGNFAVDLDPGRYMLVVVKETPDYPVPKPTVVDVERGVVTNITLVLDTGIR